MEREFGTNVVSSGSEISASASCRPENVTQRKSKESTAPASSREPSSKQKSSGHGKRQSGRGADNAYSTRNTEYGRAVASAELGSVSRPGSKKGSALCDVGPFYDKRRGGNYNGGRGHSGGMRRFDFGGDSSWHHNYGRRNRNSSLCYSPSYNKEQYLQATCQFVVTEGFNYAAHISDADLIVDWDRIEELRLAVDESPCCPICLYPPNAAKITRCGHIFCWPCILHYLALSDKAWRKCPICYESVYKNHLKSVNTSMVTNFNLHGEMSMLLMRREKGSNIVLPASENGYHKSIQQVDGPNAPFSKLLLISRDQVIDKIVERERTELLVKLAEDENEPEACFVRDALDTLQEREKLLKGEKPSMDKPSCGSPPVAPLFLPTAPHQTDIFVDAFNDEKRSGGSCSVRSAQSAPAAVRTSGRLSSPFNNGKDEFHTDEVTVASGVDTMAIAAAAVSTMNDKFYYFYQASDGQQVYLHPVSARCFIHQYGSLAMAPSTITGVIADIETFVMTEELRRRYRYLSHLPLATTVRLVELQLPTEILSSETMKLFSSDFAKREEARQRKAKEEKRQQTQAERWERAVMLDPRNYSKFASSNTEPPEIPIPTYVPSAQRDIQAALTDNLPNDAHADVAAASSFPPLAVSADVTSAPSFAQMLRYGKPKPAATSQSPNHPAVNGMACDEEEGEHSHAHSFQESFGDALQLAFDNYRRSNADAAEADEEQPASNLARKKKKKKAKGRVLLSMGTVAPGLH